MPLPPVKNGAVGAGRAVSRSRSANERQEESVYNIGGAGLPPAAPKVRVHNVGPASPTGASKPRMHVDSSQVASVLHPVHGVRDAQVRQGIKPFNYARSNALAVKEQSHLNALRKAAVADQEKLQGERPTFARSNSAPMRRQLSAGRQQYDRDDVDGEADAAGAAARRNFVMENKLGAAAPLRAPKPDGNKDDDGLKYLQKRDYGRVPAYLVERKMELAEAAEAAARAKEAALIPPGMRLLPEEERLETLAILERNRKDVEKALQSLPIIIETPSAIRRKDDLEKRLREIEDAFKIFSRSKVLVHL